MLNEYAGRLFNGEDDIKKDIPKAVDLCREAASLGNESALKKLPVKINWYAVNLYNGGNGLTQDAPRDIALCQEAASLGNPDAIRNLPMMLASSRIR